MKYKALVFDLDGTAIPNRPDSHPSQRVIEAVAAAQKKLSVSAATGRSLGLCDYVLEQLHITAPCVISGGTQVYDPQHNTFLWEKRLTTEQAKAIYDVCRQYPYDLAINEDKWGLPMSKRQFMGNERVMYVMSVNPEDTEKMTTQLKQIPDLAVHAVKSWIEGDFDLHITHIQATKKHALEVLQATLGIKPEDTIAIGDSGNDLPLFELAGFKIAMENGSDALKSQADFIAPSVDEDGVAVAIEKFILS
jgi:HAD superfamily hydrolase (TIGR01484 family)